MTRQPTCQERPSPLSIKGTQEYERGLDLGQFWWIGYSLKLVDTSIKKTKKKQAH